MLNPSPATQDNSSSNIEVRQYIDLVEDALTRVGPDYYLLPTTYRPRGITRERIYCYELYHQIRLLMRPHHTLSLHGEIDKRGHVDFAVADRANPDFVFHIPGTHTDNTLVIEVKGAVADGYRRKILKDFRTLLAFTSRYHYQAGLFVLFGHSLDELMESVGRDLRARRNHSHARFIHVITIAQAGGPCDERLLSEI